MRKQWFEQFLIAVLGFYWKYGILLCTLYMVLRSWGSSCDPQHSNHYGLKGAAGRTEMRGGRERKEDEVRKRQKEKERL